MASRVALVTGSGKKRVGAAIAEALARRGYRLAVHYHRSAAEAAETASALESHGAEVSLFQADLADDAAARGLIDTVLARFEKIDVLVNSAAIWEPIPFEKITAADMRRNFDINALGTFLCGQQAGLAMVKQPEGGLIVNIGDWADSRPYLNFAAYFASKGAVASLTRALAVELGTRNPNVRVNCILPGPMMMPPTMTQEEKDEAIAGTLVKREGSPLNVAQAVLSFVDNDYITGVCLPVDGGRTVYAGGM